VISTAISSFSVNNSKNEEKYIVSESDTVVVENMIKEYF
jgi:hypothetical protein